MNILNKKIFLIVVLSIGLFSLATLSVVVPLLMTDGTEKFSGVQKEVARKAITEVDYEYSGLENIVEKNGIYFSTVVDEVRPTVGVDQSGTGGSCVENGKVSSDSQQISHYTAIVSHRSFFGATITRIVMPGCFLVKTTPD